MSLIQKVFEKFRAENNMDKQPNAQTIYFKDDKMYKVYPTDKESCIMHVILCLTEKLMTLKTSKT